MDIMSDTCVCLFVPSSWPNVCASSSQSATREQAEASGGEEIGGRSTPRRLGRLLNSIPLKATTNSIQIDKHAVVYPPVIPFSGSL